MTRCGCLIGLPSVFPRSRRGLVFLFALATVRESDSSASRALVSGRCPSLRWDCCGCSARACWSFFSRRSRRVGPMCLSFWVSHLVWVCCIGRLPSGGRASSSRLLLSSSTPLDCPRVSDPVRARSRVGTLSIVSPPRPQPARRTPTRRANRATGLAGGFQVWSLSLRSGVR